EGEVGRAEELADPAHGLALAARGGEVEAGAEEPARAGEDDRADGVVRARLVEGASEVREERLVLRVRRRPVERQDADAPVALVGADRRHAPRRRAENASSAATSTAVQASASPPSRRARSAASVTQWAANSGWWFTAGREAIPMRGWMLGRACDTFPMSVEPAARSRMTPRSGNDRPSASAFRRYTAASAGSWRTSAYGFPLARTSRRAPVARAPASKHRRTFVRTSSSSWRFRARTT